MEAIYIVKHGQPEIAFERRKIKLSTPEDNEISIEVEAFGLNFADVTARLGLYKEFPKPPAIPGLEVVGRIINKGEGVHQFELGDRVAATALFGGYATHINTDAKAAVKIDEDYDTGKALALVVQYSTAYYASTVAANIRAGEKVLIQAAAGGVGTALIQLCKLKGCKIYGTAGSAEKIKYLKKQGVDVPINYQEQDFSVEIKEKMDVVFDSIGGKTFKQGLKLLDYGGRMVAFGAASQLEISNFFQKVKFGFSFGFYHPVMFIMNSKTMAGVNMLKLGIHKPDVLQHCLQEVVRLAKEKKINPYVGNMYPVEQINEAHSALEKRATMGKIGVFW